MSGTPTKHAPLAKVLSIPQMDLLRFLLDPSIKLYSTSGLRGDDGPHAGNGQGKGMRVTRPTFEALWKMGCFKRSDSFIPYYTLSQRGRAILKLMETLFRYDVSLAEASILAALASTKGAYLSYDHVSGKIRVYGPEPASYDTPHHRIMAVKHDADLALMRARLVVAYEYTGGGVENFRLTADGERVAAEYIAVNGKVGTGDGDSRPE